MHPQIEIRYFDGCPHWEQTRHLVEEVLAAEGIEADVRLTAIADPEIAERLAFRGSPTVLVDGVDPWGNPAAPVGLSCRVYRTGDSFSGTPPRDELRAAILGT
jgi:hypothetical protein